MTEIKEFGIVHRKNAGNVVGKRSLLFSYSLRESAVSNSELRFNPPRQFENSETKMKLCAVSESLGHLSFEEAAKASADLGLAGLEIGMGNWSAAPAC